MNALVSTNPTTSAPKTKASPTRALCALRVRVASMLEAAEPHGQAALLMALRLLFGWQFAQAGWGKLTHLEGTTGFFEGLGLPAPAITAGLVGLTELVGGTLLLTGLGTRLAAAALAFTMGMAILTAHAEEAFQSLGAFTEQAPFPYLLAALIVLAFGPGRWSADAVLRRRARRRAEAA